MSKTLIITEKPSVAQDFAKVFNVSGRKNGYIENHEYVITWCVGHLVEMVYPEEYDIKYKKWILEDLPFLPEKYKYIGFDFALTNEGWDLIEGNWGQFVGQIAAQEGIKNKFDKYLGLLK